MEYRVGIDLGGTNVAVGVVNENKEIVARANVPTRPDRMLDDVIYDIACCVKEAVKKAGITLQECVLVGIGSPGYCRAADGMVVYAGNLGWKNVPICDELRQELGVSVRLSNDANCAALGEVVAGAAKGAKSAVLLTLGTGVGGGVVLNGKVYEGDVGPGTEMGHTTLILGGEPCTCGQRGCLEAYASATGLLRQRHRAEQAHPETTMKRFHPADGSAPFICAAEGDETAKAVVEQYITYVGAGIVNFVNIFAPDAMVLDCGCGGGANIKTLLKLCPKGKVQGIDYSAVSVEKARKVNAGAIAAGRCNVQQASVAELPFEAEQFDVVTAFETVYFWPELAQNFREVYRVLKPGGVFFICNEANGDTDKDKKWTEIIGGMTIYTDTALKEYLEQAGFCKIQSNKNKKGWLCVTAQKR